MKVSIDGILGSARKINSQKQLDEENLGNKKKQVKTDSVSINSRINSRLDTIENELRDIQSSMTRNQTIRSGLLQLQEDVTSGGRNQQNILDNTTFDGTKVLSNFVGSDVNAGLLESKLLQNGELLNNDMTSLKTLQVELDNIMASDLAGQDRLGSIMQNVDTVFSSTDTLDLENMTRLNADSVMRLIK